MSHYGNATADLLDEVFERGVRRAVVLMRHSAREYHPERHDLENPLTDEGRSFAVRLGERLPKQLTLRAYASPPERCMETAALILDAHRQLGGVATRHRALEALGVFYSLDQIRMWQGMKSAGGLVPYVQSWVAGLVPKDAMISSELAASIVLDVLQEKLASRVADEQLDVCVSHDMTLYLLRSQLLGEQIGDEPVEYLDGLVLFEEGDDLKMKSRHGSEITLSV